MAELSLNCDTMKIFAPGRDGIELGILIRMSSVPRLMLLQSFVIPITPLNFVQAERSLLC